MTMEQKNADSSQPKRSGWRRWFQYRLRTLMVLMLLAAIGMNWLKKRAETQRSAVEVILGSSGYVAYDYQLSNPSLSFDDPRAWNLNAEMRWPAWLRKLAGDDYFRTAIAADVHSDGAASRLDDLPNLRALHLCLGPVTDTGLVKLPKLQKLRNLDLSNTWITDAGMVEISRLGELEELNLAETKISDAGLEHLLRLDRLKWLTLPRQISTGAKERLAQSLPGCVIL